MWKIVKVSYFLIAHFGHNIFKVLNGLILSLPNINNWLSLPPQSEGYTTNQDLLSIPEFLFPSMHTKDGSQKLSCYSAFVINSEIIFIYRFKTIANLRFHIL